MADPSAGASTPAIPQSDLEAVAELSAGATYAELIHHGAAETQIENADLIVEACEKALPFVESMKAETAREIADVASQMREVEQIADRLAKASEALERVRAAHVRIVSNYMKSAGIDTMRAAGYLFTFNRRNDMAIADLAAAVDHAGRLGMAERIYSPIKVDRTLVLKLARDLEATDVQLEGCARVPTVTFSVKETE